MILDACWACSSGLVFGQDQIDEAMDLFLYLVVGQGWMSYTCMVAVVNMAVVGYAYLRIFAWFVFVYCLAPFLLLLNPY